MPDRDYYTKTDDASKKLHDQYVDHVAKMLTCRSVGCGTASQTQSGNAVDYAKFRSRSHAAVIRVYDEAGNVIETHEHAGDFREP